MKVFLDSELVSRQVNGIFEAKDQRMKIYCDRVMQLVKRFRRINIQTIKMELNAKVDRLAKGAACGGYEKRNKLTTSNNYPAEVNMVDAKDEVEPKVPDENWMNS